MQNKKWKEFIVGEGRFRGNMKKLTEKQYYYIQDALLSKFYEQEKSGIYELSEASRRLIDDKLRQLLPNNFFDKVIARIKIKEKNIDKKGEKWKLKKNLKNVGNAKNILSVPIRMNLAVILKLALISVDLDYFVKCWNFKKEKKWK